MAIQQAADLILYGDSLFLAGVKAQLQVCGCFTLKHVRLEGATAGCQGLLAAGVPRVLLFDMTATPPDFIVPLLRERPNLMLIGLDPSSDEMLVVTCRPASAASVGDLVAVIRRGTKSVQRKRAWTRPRRGRGAWQKGLGGMP